MNAPWKPGVAGSRAPFLAFACDDGSVEALRPIAAPTIAGTWKNGWEFQGPASISATRARGSADSRFASTHPPEPAPTMM